MNCHYCIVENTLSVITVTKGSPVRGLCLTLGRQYHDVSTPLSPSNTLKHSQHRCCHWAWWMRCVQNKSVGNFIFENFQIDGAAFISALGGALSLFLGISISMVFEVIEFVIDLTLNICLLCSKGKKKVDDSEKGKHFFSETTYKETAVLCILSISF